MTENKLWPAALQIPLLQAAFLSGEAGIQAWEVWKSQVNMDHQPDLGSFRLLPQLYRNLQRLNVDDPLLMKLKGIVRQRWYKNQRFFKSIMGPLQTFQEAGIQPMLLYGPALALRYHSDYALDGGVSLAVLVRPNQARAAIEQLRATGWQPEARLPESLLDAYLRVGTVHTFKDNLARRLQLHWRLLPECPLPEADELFWAAATTATLANIPIHVLSPADQILHICTQDSSTSETSPFLRAIDVMMVINAVVGQVDWARLLWLAQRYRLAWPLRGVFEYLDQRQLRPMPPEIWQQIQTLPITLPERWEYRLKRAPFVVTRRLARLWFNYTRRSDYAGLAGFPTYLKQLWRLERLEQVPGQALSATWSRLQRTT
jgi:hypothetical protein